MEVPLENDCDEQQQQHHRQRIIRSKKTTSATCLNHALTCLCVPLLIMSWTQVPTSTAQSSPFSYTRQCSLDNRILTFSSAPETSTAASGDIFLSDDEASSSLSSSSSVQVRQCPCATYERSSTNTDDGTTDINDAVNNNFYCLAHFDTCLVQPILTQRTIRTQNEQAGSGIIPTARYLTRLLYNQFTDGVYREEEQNEPDNLDTMADDGTTSTTYDIYTLSVSCYSTTGTVSFVRSFWPVALLWVFALMYALVCTEWGCSARDYMRRKVLSSICCMYWFKSWYFILSSTMSVSGGGGGRRRDDESGTTTPGAPSTASGGGGVAGGATSSTSGVDSDAVNPAAQDSVGGSDPVEVPTVPDSNDAEAGGGNEVGNPETDTQGSNINGRTEEPATTAAAAPAAASNNTTDRAGSGFVVLTDNDRLELDVDRLLTLQPERAAFMYRQAFLRARREQLQQLEQQQQRLLEEQDNNSEGGSQGSRRRRRSRGRRRRSRSNSRSRSGSRRRRRSRSNRASSRSLQAGQNPLNRLLGRSGEEADEDGRRRRGREGEDQDQEAGVGDNEVGSNGRSHDSDDDDDYSSTSDSVDTNERFETRFDMDAVPEICNALGLRVRKYEPPQSSLDANPQSPSSTSNLEITQSSSWLRPPSLRQLQAAGNPQNNNSNNERNMTFDDMDDELENGMRCAICLMKLQRGDLVGNIPCKHMFHKDCLKDWLRQKNRCPLCQRSNIARLGYQSKHPRSTPKQQRRRRQQQEEPEQNNDDGDNNNEAVENQPACADQAPTCCEGRQSRQRLIHGRYHDQNQLSDVEEGYLSSATHVTMASSVPAVGSDDSPEENDQAVEATTTATTPAIRTTGGETTAT